MKKLLAWTLLLVLLLSGCGAAGADSVPTDEAPAVEDPVPEPDAGAPAEPAVPAGSEAETEPADGETEPPSEESAPSPAEDPAAAEDPPASADAPAAEDPPASADAPAASSDPAEAAEAPAEVPASLPLPEVPADTPAGIWENEDGLYYVQEDGTLLVDGTVGYLTFGADGRYTSGDAELDAGIDGLVASVCPDVSADREGRLRLLYGHIRDNYRYLSMDHYAAGSTGWDNAAASLMLSQGKGNCYNFTALFTACARRLGYQAYSVAGHEYRADNDHAWTMIQWPDGVTYLFDVQLEYAYQYLYANKRDLDMFKVAGSGGSYSGFQYYFP